MVSSVPGGRSAARSLRPLIGAVVVLLIVALPIGGTSVALAGGSAGTCTPNASTPNGCAPGGSLPATDPTTPFTSLATGFSQVLFGSTGTFLGGVAFAPNGDVWSDECLFSGSDLLRFSQTSTFQQDGATLASTTDVPSNAGCGLANNPDGFIYSNTGDGVAQLDASSGAALRTMGPAGNALGITTDPSTGHVVYVGADCRFSATCTIWSLDPSTGTASTFAVLPSSDAEFVDGIAFDPSGRYLFLSTRAPFFALTILDRSGAVVQQVPMGSEPDGIAFHVSPAFVVTNDTDGTMTRFTFAGGDFTQAPSVDSFASGGYRGDLASVGADTCIYLTQGGTNFPDGVSSFEDSLVKICPGFAPPPGVSSQRTVEYVHGINGNFRNFQCGNLSGGYSAVLQQVCSSPTQTLDSFPYYQDAGYSTGSSPPCGGMPLPDLATGPLYVDPSAVDPDTCDSKGALAYTASALDTHLAALTGPVTVMANSMGGAIVRGWLALANFNGPTDASLSTTDSVIFLQGAQAGSWAAGVGESLNGTPILGAIVRKMTQLAGFDLNRPGVMDVAPVSPWYDSVNPSVPSPGVPPQLAYYNFYSNIKLDLNINYIFGSITVQSFDLGDLVMLPGSDNPNDEPSSGGARFLPGGANTTNRHEFEATDSVSFDQWDVFDPGTALVADLAKLIASPVNHFNFGSQVSNVQITGCGPGAPQVSAASEIVRVLQDPVEGCAS